MCVCVRVYICMHACVCVGMCVPLVSSSTNVAPIDTYTYVLLLGAMERWCVCMGTNQSK